MGSEESDCVVMVGECSWQCMRCTDNITADGDSKASDVKVGLNQGSV